MRACSPSWRRRAPGAQTAEQFAAATQAVVAKARITGKLIDRLEVGAVGAFDRATTPIEVVDILLAQLDDGEDVLAKLDELRELVIQRLAERARSVLPRAS